MAKHEPKRWYDSEGPVTRKGGAVYTLIADMTIAVKIVKAATDHHLTVRNFDRSEHLLAACAGEAPVLVIIDWDKREAEGYRWLAQHRQREQEDPKTAVVGFVSKTKEAVKAEAQRAGCDRVYFKTEFLNELNAIFTRYAV